MPKSDLDLASAEASVRAVLSAVGQNPDREGLRDTPRRVVAALLEMTSGEREDPATHLAVSFDAGSFDEIVALAGISFTSTCEHHLLPFTGYASVAYVPSCVEAPVYGPNGLLAPGKYRVVGLSKLARVVDVFARRLQLQEQLTTQIADALDVHLQPAGVGVLIEAEHSCMSCRGVRKAGAVMRTSVMRGVFRTKPEARAEALRLMELPR